MLSSQGEMVLRNPRLLEQAQRPVSSPDVPPDGSESSVPASSEAGEAVHQALINPSPPVVCRTLLAVYIFVFAAGMYVAAQEGAPVGGITSAHPPPITQVTAIRKMLGALNPSEVAVTKEWWRLVAYAFVSPGLLNFALSMYLPLFRRPAPRIDVGKNALPVSLLGRSPGGWLRRHAHTGSRRDGCHGCYMRLVDVVGRMWFSSIEILCRPFSYRAGWADSSAFSFSWPSSTSCPALVGSRS